MAHLPDTDPRHDGADHSVLLPAGMEVDDELAGGPGRPRRWRRIAGVIAVVIGAGVLSGGAVALVARVGWGSPAATSSTASDGATTDGTASDGAQPDDGAQPADGAAPATPHATPDAASGATGGESGPVAEFESFARGLDGVSDGDAAVVVEVVAVADGETPRGTADVLLDATGEGRIAEVAEALTGWTGEAESAGRIIVDVRLSTTNGAVDLSRPESENAERLAVAAEVLGDDEVSTYWIGASRVDLVVAAGTDQRQALERWTARVREIAPSMAVTVRSAGTD